MQWGEEEGEYGEDPPLSATKGLSIALGGGIQQVQGKGDDGYVGVVDVNSAATAAVAAAANDNVTVDGDHCNDDGATVTVAVGEANAMIATTTVEGGDNAPVPAPPSTHPSRAALTTTSDNNKDEQGGRRWHEDDDNVNDEQGEDNNVGPWAMSRKRAAAKDVNKKYAVAGGMEGVGGCVDPLSSSDGPPPIGCLSEERGRCQQRR
jgi:hypothetical protein